MAVRGLSALETDRALARRMLKGEELAFDEFFAAYFPGLYRFALVRVSNDADAAEEIVQSTLCAAVSKMSTYRAEAPLFSWLCTFCRHEIFAYCEKNRRQPAAIALPEDRDEVQAALDSLVAADGDSPEMTLRRKELARLVRVALDRLPAHYGNALEWKYIDDASVNEIAARLKMGPKAAESVLTRAREAFRDAFAALCGGRSGLDSAMDGVQ
jgi:RNA polymerase sigma-70 factor, ECF subfamily